MEDRHLDQDLEVLRSRCIRRLQQSGCLRQLLLKTLSYLRQFAPNLTRNFNCNFCGRTPEQLRHIHLLLGAPEICNRLRRLVQDEGY